MKKIMIIVSVLILTFVLVSCGTGTTSKDLIISKYYETEDIFENAVEIFNPLGKEVNLEDYTLDIYSNGDAEITYSINLEGTLLVDEYYVIRHTDATEAQLIDQSDLSSDDLLFNGNDVIALTKKGKIVDILGFIGSSVTYAKDVTLIRKPGITLANSKYMDYDFIMYVGSAYEYLKNEDYQIKTDKDFLDGPQLQQRDKDLPFVDPDNNNLGGGGAIKVNLFFIADGDTAHFKDDFDNLYKVRFNLIDTREVDGSNVNAQEWGYPASNFTKNILNNSTEFYIQSVKGAQLKDTYDRYLGYVWADGQLVNFLVVKAGMSQLNFDFENVTSGDVFQNYKGVPYFSFVANAHNRAENNKWGVHGETDPTWDYTARKPKSDKSFLPDARLYGSAKNEK